MIAIAMYVLLGVFATLLLTLLIMPMIWRRAVRLTEKRVLAETPISLSELQAEKDMQRAEMAIELRRMELTADARMDEVANQSLKIDRLKKEIEDRDIIIADRKADIERLTSDLDNQIKLTNTSDKNLNKTSDALETAKQNIADLESTRKELEEEIIHLETAQNEQKIEVVAQLAQIENYKERVAELTSERNSEKQHRSDAESQLSQKSAEADRSKEHLERNQEKLDQLQSQIADKDANIENLERQLERALAQKSDDGAETSQRLAEAETRRVEAEAKIASLTLQIEHQQLTEDGENLSTVIDGLQKEKMDLEAQLSEALLTAKDLEKELKALKKKAVKSEKEQPLSPRELLLRNEIKTIAAKITGFTAEMEGASSPIHALMATEAPATSTIEETTHDAELPTDPAEPVELNGDNGIGQASADTGEKKNDPWDQVFSLADQIREMDNQSDEKKANH